MSLDWSPLTRELAAWRAEGRALTLWWRDDDAIEPTPALDQLLQLAEDLQLTVHLAVIPEPATQALAEVVRGTARARALVHGWAHRDHALAGEKKAEFGQPRDGAMAETAAALPHLRGLFGDDLCAIFVPPWNRIAPRIVACLPDHGYRAVSTYGPRRARLVLPGLVQINTHIDPIHWRGNRSLADPAQQIATLTAHLADRRAGRADAAEPLGFLSHHLVHDPQVWGFTRACLCRLLDGGATPLDFKSLKGPLP